MSDDTTTPEAPRHAAEAPLRPLAGFWPLFLWGLRLTCRWPRLLGIGIPLLLFSWWLGFEAVSRNRKPDEWLDLFVLLDEAMLAYILPLIALLTVASGLRVEIGRKTMVYHLVRPVSRSTLYLSRFASGVVPAAVLGTVALAACCVGSGVSLPGSVWISLPLTAAIAALTVGAGYYLVTTWFRGGMIVALVYTFVFEPLFSGTRGSMQKLSLMFHVRGVHHGMTDEVFAENSRGVRRALDPTTNWSSLDPRSPDFFQDLQERIAYDEPWTAFLTCVAITAGLLLFGAWQFARRDFPLKD